MKKKHGALFLVFTALDCDAASTMAGEFRIDFGSRNYNRCSFVASPIDYCDPEFIRAYEQALHSSGANFNHGMVVLAIDSRPEYAQQTVVAISLASKTVYPLPFDFFTDSFAKNRPKKHGQVKYTLDSNSVCVDGEIMAYRSIQSTNLCWHLEVDQFVGEITPYTYPDN